MTNDFTNLTDAELLQLARELFPDHTEAELLELRDFDGCPHCQDMSCPECVSL